MVRDEFGVGDEQSGLNREDPICQFLGRDKHSKPNWVRALLWGLIAKHLLSQVPVRQLLVSREGQLA